MGFHRGYGRRTKEYSFNVISEERMTGGNPDGFGVGSSFTYVGADKQMSVTDNDRRMGGDFCANERGSDRQSGSLTDAGGTKSAGNIYAERLLVLRGDDGRYYLMIEIEGTSMSDDPADDDVFAFYGRTPAAGVTLTAVWATNIYFGVRYDRLDGGDLVVEDVVNDDIVVASEDEDGTVTLANLLSNDTSGSATALVVSALNGDKLAIGVWVDLEEGGRVLVAADGSVRFEANEDLNSLVEGEVREIALQYSVENNQGTETVGNFTIKINGENDAPDLIDGATETKAGDAAVSFDLATLASDLDVDDDASTLTYQISRSDTRGDVSLDGSIVTFTSGDDFTALSKDEETDVNITVTVTDRHGAETVGALIVKVTGRNEQPEITSATLALNEDAQVVSLALDELANDADNDDDGATLNYAITSAPGQGTATIEDGLLSFEPGDSFQRLAEGEVAEVVIGVSATDRHGATTDGLVTVNVTGKNDRPVAEDLQLSATALGGAIGGAFSAFDADDNDLLTFSILEQPVDETGAQIGEVINNNDGTFSFQADDAFEFTAGETTKTVNFTYVATDNSGAANATSDVAVGTITVTKPESIEFSGQVTFITEDQSSGILGDDETVARTGEALDDLPSITIEWDENFDILIAGSREFRVGSFLEISTPKVTLSGETTGAIEFQPYLIFESDELDAEVPVQVSVSSQPVARAGETISFDTALFVDDGAGFTTKSPTVKFGMDVGIDYTISAGLELNRTLGSIKIKVDELGIDFSDTRTLTNARTFKLLDIDVSADFTLFEAGFGEDLIEVTKPLEDLGLFDTIRTDPLFIETTSSAVDDENRSFEGSGFTDFFEINGLDVDQTISNIVAGTLVPFGGVATGLAGVGIGGINSLDIPRIGLPNKIDLPEFVNFVGISDISLPGGAILDGKLGLDLFDIKLDKALSLLQETEMTLNDVLLDIQFEDGNVVNDIRAGDSFDFKPANGFDAAVDGNANGALDYDVFVDLDASFRTKYGFGVEAFVDLSVLSVDIDFESDFIGDFTASKGPVFSRDDLKLIDRTDDFYDSEERDLGGFQSDIFAFSGQIDIV